ncbi:MAG TPA: ATP-dependent zinc metalloprotease FtsH [Longimicrobiales bacterium]|nr:ATP-dependent zinc metalloprotease FtsH [Longimicrobiales bacterium]
MANKQKPDSGDRDERGGRWARNSRTLSFWVLFVLVSVLLVQLFSPRQRDAADLTYSEFITQLERGNVEAVVFVGGKRLEGDLRGAVTSDGRQVESFLTDLPISDSEVLVTRLQDADVQIDAREPDQNWWALVLGALPWILILGIWIFMLRQMQSGGSRAFQFGKSKAKVLSADTPQVTFADVAGADEAKEELTEIIAFLKDPQKFTRLGGRLPKGALLVGPPGTGKTLLARAVAGEAGRPFFSMSGSDFVEMFVGVGASRVRDLFEQGKAHAPCIIFIDEIDAVGRHRGAGLGGGHDEREQTLNQLLVEMDGFESNEGVILLAATNRPDVLDPALLRPGRFDRQIVVDAPDVNGREGILRVHLKKVPLAEDVKVATLARGTPGLSCADLANLVNEAALLAARRGRDRVVMADLESAKDKIMLGAERKSMVLSEAERKLTAFHEAGHAVVALKVPGLDPIHKVTIVPRGRALGVTASLPEEDRHSYSRDYLVAQLAMLFGGRAAEEMIFGAEKITTGAGNDIQRATNLARRMVTSFGMSEKVGPMAVGDAEQEVFLGRELVQRREVSEETARLVDDEVKAFLDEAYQRAMDTLREHRDLLDRLAEALLERETLDREEIGMLAEGTPLPPFSTGDDPVEGAPAPGDEQPNGAVSEETAGGPATADAEGDQDQALEADPEHPVTAGNDARRVRTEEPEADAS